MSNEAVIEASTQHSNVNAAQSSQSSTQQSSLSGTQIKTIERHQIKLQQHHSDTEELETSMQQTTLDDVVTMVQNESRQTRQLFNAVDSKINEFKTSIIEQLKKMVSF